MDLVAIYAAVVATVVLGWDIYKWKTSGPKILLYARSNQKIYPQDQKTEGVYVHLRATNAGDTPTTISNPAFFYYKNRVSWLFNLIPWTRLKPDQSYYIKNPGATKNTPCKLEPGDVWDGFAIQSEEIEEIGSKGLLYFALYTSHKARPVTRRVIFI